MANNSTIWKQVTIFLTGIFDNDPEVVEDSENEVIEYTGKPIWCVVANVINEHPFGEGKEIKRGTKHFPAGAKVYCFPVLWGDGYERIKVVGHHRGSHKLITLVMLSNLLENWRVKMVYSPQVIKRLQEHWDGSTESKEIAANIVAEMKNRTEKP